MGVRRSILRRKTTTSIEHERINLVDVHIAWSDGRETVGWLEITEWNEDGSPRSMKVYERRTT